jgi:hypothetical protein
MSEKKDEEESTVKIRDISDEGVAQTKEMRFTKRFTLEWDSEDGVKQGEFTIKRPTIGEQARIGVRLAELREDRPQSAIDWKTLQLHEWIATCAIVVTSAPPWWEPENSYDIEPLRRVYGRALEFFNSFRRKGVEQRPGTTSSGSSG